MLGSERALSERDTTDDAAAHPTEIKEGETTEHLAFGDVVPVPTAWRMRFASCSSYAIGILLLTVRHLLAVSRGLIGVALWYQLTSSNGAGTCDSRHVFGSPFATA